MNAPNQDYLSLTVHTFDELEQTKMTTGFFVNMQDILNLWTNKHDRILSILLDEVVAKN